MMSRKRSQVKSLWGSAFMKLKKTNFLLFLSKGKHWCILTLIVFSLYNCLYVIAGYAFML
jgi:hypothetical protein